MKTSGKVFLFIVAACAFGSCFEPPHFSNVPYIDTPTIRFVDVADASADDTLIVAMNFKDGDGDLGLGDDAADVETLFAERYYFLLPTSSDFAEFGPIVSFNKGYTVVRIPTDSGDTLANYADKRTRPGYDTLPPYLPPYSCTRWQIITENDANGHELRRDTLATLINKNFYNIFVDVYIQNLSNGQFEYFDFVEQFCDPIGFNGRFPILSSDLNKPGPLEGKLTYSIPSSGWTSNFGNKVIKLKITIQDRKLQKSNVLETPAFTLH